MVRRPVCPLLGSLSWGNLGLVAMMHGRSLVLGSVALGKSFPLF